MSSQTDIDESRGDEVPGWMTEWNNSLKQIQTFMDASPSERREIRRKNAADSHQTNREWNRCYGPRSRGAKKRWAKAERKQ